MRRWPIAAAVAGLTLVLAGVALAYTFTQKSNITLTQATKAGQSAGISSNVSSNPNGPSWAAKQLKVTFPTGTKFGLGTVPSCPSGKNCPSASKIGSGSANAIAFGSHNIPVTGSVAAYVAGAQKMILVVTVTQPVKSSVSIPATTSGNVLSITIPSPSIAGHQVVLTSLNLTVKPHGTGNKALVTAGKCTGNQWVVKSHFVYANGKTKDITSKSGFCT